MCNHVISLLSRIGYPPATHYFEKLTDIELAHLEPYDVVILDNNNLLVPYGAHQVIPGGKAWVQQLLDAGKTVAILSNCPEKGRWAENLRQVAAELKVDGYIVFGRTRKPKPYGFHYIRAGAGVNAHKVCMIGDQQFTDVAGARRCGMAAMYVKPCGRDGWHTRHKRLLERVYFKIIAPKWGGS